MAPGGGLTILESGKYFITFTATASSTLPIPSVTYTINAGGFVQTVTSPAGTGTATISLVRYLRRGDTVTVTATTAAGTTINATLSVAKISSRFSEKDFH
ncbi:hypothetical protein CN383_07255 [Priestia megaterium]|nr:hypothetical protein CN383_07255 [Priestia megaterium]PFR93140.1 hypothetical protein COK39_18820 [Priestia megaterium]